MKQMFLLDVNVLVYAHREDSANHTHYLNWLEGLINGDRTFGVSDLVFSGFLRIVSNPRIFIQPSQIDKALVFVDEIRGRPHFVSSSPGPAHWKIFVDLCRSVEARGNLIPDAFLAAMAIESGNTWITSDSDYSRFPGLDWRHPLAS